MKFSLRVFLMVVAWCAIVMGAIAAMLRLPERSTDVPVGILFALVFCSALIAAVLVLVDRSDSRPFWIGYFVICLACWLASHSAPLMKAHTLPSYAAAPIMRLRSERSSSVEQSNQMYYGMIRVLNLGAVPILGILAGCVARARNPTDVRPRKNANDEP